MKSNKLISNDAADLNSGKFKQLPIGIRLKILSGLTPRQLIALAKSNKYFNKLLTDNLQPFDPKYADIKLFWRNKFEIHFPISYRKLTGTREIETIDWYREFTDHYKEMVCSMSKEPATIEYQTYIDTLSAVKEGNLELIKKRIPNLKTLMHLESNYFTRLEDTRNNNTAYSRYGHRHLIFTAGHAKQQAILDYFYRLWMKDGKPNDMNESFKWGILCNQHDKIAELLRANNNPPTIDVNIASQYSDYQRAINVSVYHGHVETTQALLPHYANTIDDWNPSSENLLSCASRFSNEPLVELLLFSNAVQIYDGFLRSAIQSHNQKLIATLINNNPTHIESNFHDAVSSGNPDTLKLLLDKYAEIKGEVPELVNRIFDNYTLLQIAAMYQYPLMINTLIHYGANVNACGSGNNTALHSLTYGFWHSEYDAIARDNMKNSLISLLNHGADNQKKNLKNISPLQNAVASKNNVAQIILSAYERIVPPNTLNDIEPFLTMLINNPSRPSLDNMYGRAILGDSVEALRALLDNRDKIHQYLNIPLDLNMSLITATSNLTNQAMSIINLLVEYGADKQYQTEDNKTLLHHAVLAQNKKLVSELLNDDPSNINTLDADGKTPLDYAIKNKLHDIIAILVSHKAIANTQVNFKQAAIEAAIEAAIHGGDVESCDKLLANTKDYPAIFTPFKSAQLFTTRNPKSETNQRIEQRDINALLNRKHLEQYITDMEKQNPNSHKTRFTLFGKTIINFGYSARQKVNAARALLDFLDDANQNHESLLPHIGALTNGHLGEIYRTVVPMKKLYLKFPRHE